jgi:hypothetical protein
MTTLENNSAVFDERFLVLYQFSTQPKVRPQPYFKWFG